MLVDNVNTSDNTPRQQRAEPVAQAILHQNDQTGGRGPLLRLRQIENQSIPECNHGGREQGMEGQQ